MDNSQNNTNTRAAEPTDQPNGQHGQPIIFVNYTFAYAPHAQGGATQPDETAQRTTDPQGRYQNGFFIYGMPVFDTNTMGTIFGFGPAGGMGGEPPKPHASREAVDALKSVDVNTLLSSDRTCAICYEPYYDEKDNEHDTKHQPTLTTQEKEQAGTPVSPEELEEMQHVPLQMPCGHMFGGNCLKEWLKSSTTCPLCRSAVEAEQPAADQQSANTNGIPFIYAPFFSFFRARPEQTPTPTAPAPTQMPSPATPTTPQETAEVSTNSTSASTALRSASSGSSYSVRHHPYSRPTPPVSSSALSSEEILGALSRNDAACNIVNDTCDGSGPLVRLDCGHGYHEDCLQIAMRTHGDTEIPDLSSSSSDNARREVWCTRCRRYREVQA